MGRRAHRTLLLAVPLVAACGSGAGDAPIVRGRGLRPASLTVAEQAAAYGAAIQAAFDTGPALTLMLSPTLLPRAAGLSGGDALPSGVERALRDGGLIQGTCQAVRRAESRTPVCPARSAGYVVYLSPILSRAGDSLQLYLHAERYDTAAAEIHPAFRFESAYQLVRAEGSWRVAREGRVPQ